MGEMWIVVEAHKMSYYIFTPLHNVLHTNIQANFILYDRPAKVIQKSNTSSTQRANEKRTNKHKTQLNKRENKQHENVKIHYKMKLYTTNTV